MNYKEKRRRKNWNDIQRDELRRKEREDLEIQRQRDELESQRREEEDKRRDRENEIREQELQRQRAKDEAERKRQVHGGTNSFLRGGVKTFPSSNGT